MMVEVLQQQGRRQLVGLLTKHALLTQAHIIACCQLQLTYTILSSAKHLHPRYRNSCASDGAAIAIIQEL
jgi:hypothetical protein